MSARISSSARWADERMVRAASATSGSSVVTSSADACNDMTDKLCATVSCISRAMSSRSSCRDSSVRRWSVWLRRSSACVRNVSARRDSTAAVCWATCARPA
ncbi:Uncharacterised protein [Mycobacteroides abscessus]|nr:Uncharacterised protein [Mycobacteroides abscessus]